MQKVSKGKWDKNELIKWIEYCDEGGFEFLDWDSKLYLIEEISNGELKRSLFGDEVLSVDIEVPFIKSEHSETYLISRYDSKGNKYKHQQPFVIHSDNNYSDQFLMKFNEIWPNMLMCRLLCSFDSESIEKPISVIVPQQRFKDFLNESKILESGNFNISDGKINLQREMLVRFLSYQVLLGMNDLYNKGNVFLGIRDCNMYITDYGSLTLGNYDYIYNFNITQRICKNDIQWYNNLPERYVHDNRNKIFSTVEMQKFSVFDLGVFIFNLFFERPFFDEDLHTLKETLKQIRSKREQIDNCGYITSSLKKLLLQLLEVDYKKRPTYKFLLTENNWFNGYSGKYRGFISSLMNKFIVPKLLDTAKSVVEKNQFTSALVSDFFAFKRKHRKYKLGSEFGELAKSLNDVDKYINNAKTIYLDKNLKTVRTEIANSAIDMLNKYFDYLYNDSGIMIYERMRVLSTFILESELFFTPEKLSFLDEMKLKEYKTKMAYIKKYCKDFKNDWYLDYNEMLERHKDFLRGFLDNLMAEENKSEALDISDWLKTRITEENGFLDKKAKENKELESQFSTIVNEAERNTFVFYDAVNKSNKTVCSNIIQYFSESTKHKNIDENYIKPEGNIDIEEYMRSFVNKTIIGNVWDKIESEHWRMKLTNYNDKFKILDYNTKRSIEISTESKIISPLWPDSYGSFGTLFSVEDEFGRKEAMKLFKKFDSARNEFIKNIWVSHLSLWVPVLNFHEEKLDDNKKIGVHFYRKFILDTIKTFFLFFPRVSEDKERYPEGVSKFIGFEMDDNLSKEMLIRFFVYQIILALKYAYDSGVVYTDLKPNNILVDTRGLIGIGDSGGMCNFIYNLVNLSEIEYTVCYFPLAKEEIKNEFSSAEDVRKHCVFSLGATIYEIYSLSLFLYQKKDEATKRDNKQKAIEAGLEKIKKDKNMTKELKDFLLFIFEKRPHFDELLNHVWIKGPNGEHLNFIKKHLIGLGYCGPIRPVGPKIGKYREEILKNLLTKDFFDCQLQKKKFETVNSKETAGDFDYSVPKSINDVDMAKLEILVNRYNQNAKRIYLSRNLSDVEKKIKEVFIYDKYGYFYESEVNRDKILSMLSRFIPDMERFINKPNKVDEILMKIKKDFEDASLKDLSDKEFLLNFVFAPREILSYFENQISKWVKERYLDRLKLQKIYAENEKILSCIEAVYKIINDFSYGRSFFKLSNQPEEMVFCVQIKKYFEAKEQKIKDEQKENDKVSKLKKFPQKKRIIFKKTKKVVTKETKKRVKLVDTGADDKVSEFNLLQKKRKHTKFKSYAKNKNLICKPKSVQGKFNIIEK